jgi:hypothetical protein
VANDRSRFTSGESDCASNVTQDARKQRVDRHRIIRVEKSSSFEPILSQNSFNDYQVRFDPPCVRWSQLLRANSESRDVSSVGCRITCVTPSEANLRKWNRYTHSMIKIVAHKSEEGSVGSGNHVANDRSHCTSRESNCASNVTQVARKQRVHLHRITARRSQAVLNQF